MSLVGHEFQSTYNVGDTLRTTDALDDPGWHYMDALFPVFLLLVATFKLAIVASQILSLPYLLFKYCPCQLPRSRRP